MTMRLNTLQPAAGAKKSPKRLGRGGGSTDGKTCGRGHKGQRARGKVKQGQEGGQMPMHRRVPKFGFTSWRPQFSAEIRTDALGKIESEVIDLAALKQAGLIKNKIKFAKIIAAGDVTKAVAVKGIKVSKGAVKLIEAAGGKVEE